jgi:Zinc knuckle
MSSNTSSKDYGLESQRTVRYRPTKMTFREDDKKIINFCPGLKYWHQVLDNYHEWEKQDPVLDSKGLPIYVNGIKQTKDHYTLDEQEELKMTDRIAVSTYVQGNGPETETYTYRETAYEIRQALRERFEYISAMGLTELVAKFYDIVKVKGIECPDEWFSDMLYLNDQIVRANVATRSDAEITAHIINVAPKYYNIPLSILSQSDINASDALSKAQTELRNYWKRNLEGKIGKHGGKYHGKGNRNESAYTFSGGKQSGNQGRRGKSRQRQQQTISGNNKGKRVVGNRSWKKFKGFCRYCGIQGHKALDCTVKKQRMNTSNGNKGENWKNNCFNCGKPGHYSKNCQERKQNNLGRQQKLFCRICR